MANTKLPKWIQVITLGLVISLVFMVVVLSTHPDDPCSTNSAQELTALYPDLNALAKKHQLDTDKLLTLHRTQDVLINLKMTSEQIDPEQALQISIQQVNELAVMRKFQADEFNALCHKLVKGRV